MKKLRIRTVAVGAVRSQAPADVIVRGSRLVTGKGVVRADIAIDEGRIVKVGRAASMPASDRVIEIPSSSLILPGIVDVHAHLRDLELVHKGDFESETQAAAAGGVTFVVDMPNSKPPTLTAMSFESKKRIAQGRASVDFGLNMGVQRNEEELGAVVENIAYGEIFVGPSTEGAMIGYPELKRALRVVSATGKVACIHAEDPALFKKDLPSANYDHTRARPPESEHLAVSKVLATNRDIGARLHFCHISTRESLVEIGRYRSAGMQLTCEVTPHHLILSREVYEGVGPIAKMNPPLRDSSHVASMSDGVRSGLIDIIASDHAPHALEEKLVGEPDAPSGVPGFETFAAAVLTHFEMKGLAPPVFVRMTRLAPSKIFNIPGKGIAPGSDADLMVVSREKRAVRADTFLSKGRYSPFEGMQLRYWPIMTLLRGEVILEDGEITLRNRGRFVPSGSIRHGG